MGIFRKAVDRGIEEGIASALDKATAPGGLIEQVVKQKFNELIGANLPDNAPMDRMQFTFAMAKHLASKGAKDALPLARTTLDEYLRFEAIAFGAPDYAWDRAAARTVAQEFEIEHWEAPNAS